MKKPNITKCVLAICLLFFTFFNQSHASDPWPERTNFGSVQFAGLYGFNTASITYEMMWHKPKLHHGFSAGLTAVFWASYSWSKFGPSINYSLLTGKRDNHLEFGAGASYHPFKLSGEVNTVDGDVSLFIPYGQLGYRYQKPDGKFYLKIFAGFPVSGVGAGIRFGSK